jgi:hypothetical protein
MGMRIKDDEQTRKARRRANGKSHSALYLAEWAKQLPEISTEDAFAPGQVTHACVSHDKHCKTLRTGNGSDCTCNPDVSFHRQT